MTATPQDWRVTAYLEAKRAIAEFDGANEDGITGHDTPVLGRDEILRGYWLAYQATGAAVGALVESELRAGLTWPEISAALGFPTEADARRALDPLRAAGRMRLRDRLPDA